MRERMPHRGARSALLRLALLLLGPLAAIPPVAAEPPAARSPGPAPRARASFDRFAAGWIDEQRRRAERSEPRLRPGARAPVAVQRRPGEAYRTELRATGRPAVPYLGLVHYTEVLYTCRGLEAEGCSRAAERPRVVLFRYRDGRWQH